MESVGNDSANSNGTVLTAHATPGTDGAWTQLIAATVNEYETLNIFIGDGGVVSGLQLIDIGIGGAGSEVVIVPDLIAIVRGTAGRCPYISLTLPINVAKGSRIAARIHRGSTASTTNRIALYGQSGTSRGIPSFRRATSYGVVLASAAGTTVDPGATANTQGANTQIVASTTNPIKAFYILATRNQSTAGTVSPTTLMEFFIGAGGSEVTLIPEFSVWASNATTDISSGEYSYGPFFVNLPAGSRISAKARCSDNTATQREGMVTLVGLD